MPGTVTGKEILTGSSPTPEVTASATGRPSSSREKTCSSKAGLTLEAWITYDGSKLGTGYKWPTIIRQNPAAGKESYFFRVNAGNNKATNLSFAVNTGSGLSWATYNFKAGEFKNWTRCCNHKPPAASE